MKFKELRMANAFEIHEFMTGRRRAVAAERIHNEGDPVVFVLLEDGRLAVYNAGSEKVAAFLTKEAPSQ